MSFYDSHIWLRFRKIIPAKARRVIRRPILKVVYLFKDKLQGSFSINGEDSYMMSRISQDSKIWYLDIGCGHPTIHSNTYSFYRRGSNGVAIDANKKIVEKYKLARANDSCLWGAVSTNSDNSTITYYELDPWELSTTSDIWLSEALKNGASLVSTSNVPTLDINRVLSDSWPAENICRILNIDVEGISYAILNQIDFSKFPFDIIAVERDNYTDSFNISSDTYNLERRLGPTDIYVRVNSIHISHL